jgi:hypothetical protein
MNELSGWVPIRLYRETAETMVDWCYLGEKRFTEPFFDDTINGCLRHPFNALFRHQTPIGGLRNGGGSNPASPPRGLSFTFPGAVLPSSPRCWPHCPGT